MSRAGGEGGPGAPRGAEGAAARSRAGISTADSGLPCPARGRCGARAGQGPGVGGGSPFPAGTHQPLQSPPCPRSGKDRVPQGAETCLLGTVSQSSPRVCVSQAGDRWGNRDLPSALSWAKRKCCAVMVSGEQNLVALSLSPLAWEEERAM